MSRIDEIREMGAQIERLRREIEDEDNKLVSTIALRDSMYAEKNAENARLRAELEAAKRREQFLTEAYDQLATVHEALTRDYLAVKAERDILRARADAAERDIAIMLDTQRVCFACANRTHCNNSTTGEYACDPKWRGPQEDKPDDTFVTNGGGRLLS